MFKKDGSLVLDAPVKDRVAKAASPRRAAGAPTLRRDLSDDYAKRSVATAFGDEPEDYVPRRRFSGLRFRLRGGVPRSWAGRALAVAGVLGVLGVFGVVLWVAQSMLLHDDRLILASSASIQTVQTTGNSHLTRAQLLSIFGEDVDRNILTVPLATRRAELESLPWVEHATVMRLLPNRIRIAIVERTPVAFVRQGGHIGVVDANGVLLEMSPEVAADQHYSFPVVTGISADDPESTRAARMKIFERFTADLDSGGANVSHELSEVDLSSPEDVLALIPNGGADILVHFGDDEFLARYKRYQKNIADWKGAHPNLASVDMRYDREAVLEMKPGTAVAANVAETPAPEAAKATKPGVKAKVPAGKAGVRPAKPAVAKAKPVAAKPVKRAVPPAKAHAHLQTAFPVHPHSSQAVPQ